ncbi:MAG: class II aldolase/adducin family protein [Pseudomonadota bacterium]
MKIVSENHLREAAKAFRWAARRSFRLGLQASTGGNISIRVGPNRFLTKPTGIGLAESRFQDLVLIDETGMPLEGKARPTKEVQVHLAVFQTRPDVNGIVHYHGPHTTAYAVLGLPLPLPTLHARRILRHVPIVDEYPEGSKDLAEAVARACENPEVSGLLLASHGLMALGGTLHQAQYIAELMEESARIHWLSQHIQ